MYIPKRDEAEYQRILDEIQADREKARHNSKFLVDTILPSEEFHIIAGPSGVGKTSWLLPLIKDWSEGNKVLGYSSNPSSYVYISCDRSLKALDRTLMRIGLSDWRIHAYAIEDLDKYLLKYKVGEERADEHGNSHFKQFTYEDLQLEYLPFLFNETMQLDIKVFIVEAYGWFNEASGNNKSMYREVMRLGTKIRKAYEKYGCSLLVTTHVPKMKRGEGYANPRERIIGSVGQAAVASTVILLEQNDEEDIEDKTRIVSLCPRDSAPMIRYYELDKNGAYVLSDVQGVSPKDKKSISVLDKYLNKEQVGSLIPADVFTMWATMEKVSQATLYRWIKKNVDDGFIERMNNGLYKKAVRKII